MRVGRGRLRDVQQIWVTGFEVGGDCSLETTHRQCECTKHVAVHADEPVGMVDGDVGKMIRRAHGGRIVLGVARSPRCEKLRIRRLALPARFVTNAFLRFLEGSAVAWHGTVLEPAAYNVFLNHLSTGTDGRVVVARYRQQWRGEKFLTRAVPPCRSEVTGNARVRNFS